MQFTKVKHIKSKVILGLFFMVSLHTFAQYSQEFNQHKTAHPNAHLIRLNQETTVTIKLNDEHLDITQHFLEEDLYLDEAATYGSKRAINFSSFFELEKIEASSFAFKNGKYKEAKVEDFKEKDELDNSFYDDTKSVNFIYSNLEKGSKSKLIYSEKVKNPRFLSPFYFGDFSPIANNKFTIIADKNINFRFQEFNTENLDIQFSKKEKKGNHVYTWQLKNANEYKHESHVPTYQNVLPHIVPIITSYQNKGETINLLNSVSDLYKWYYSLVKDINKEETDAALIALVEELTANKTNDLDKVKAIYYWTQQNIKYIDFEYALGGFIPREANDVFKKKYGDCKDNSSILYKMLDIAGLKGNLTWIGTRSIPYSYEEMPTPMVDNHMILSYVYNNKTYFLDATGRYTPLEFPSSFIQGKEALISNGETEFIIEKVPVIPAKQNARIDISRIQLNDENLIGTSKTELSGYKKISFFNALENIALEEKIKEFYNGRLQKGNNKFLIEDYTETNKFSYDDNFIIDYNFNINGYAKKLSDEIYVNLNLNKELLTLKTEDDRENDIEYSYKNYYNFTNILTIPSGYLVEYVPKNINLSNDFLTCEITYKVDNNKIIYNHNFTIDFLNLNTTQQKQVNDLIKKVEKGYKEIIIFKKQ